MAHFRNGYFNYLDWLRKRREGNAVDIENIRQQ